MTVNPSDVSRYVRSARPVTVLIGVDAVEKVDYEAGRGSVFA